MKGTTISTAICVLLAGRAHAQDLILQTTSSPATCGSGVMFDLTATDSVYLHRFFYECCTSGQAWITIWFREGTFRGHENDPSGWTPIVSYSGCYTPGNGGYAGHFNYRPLTPGQTVGVFIDGPSQQTLFGYSPIPPAQAVYSDAHLTISGGAAKLGTGFGAATVPDVMWSGRVAYRRGAPGCYANCDESTTSPILTVNDFTCFLDQWHAEDSDPYFNCDGSTSPPVYNINDLMCFLNAYAAGCTAP